MYEDFDTANRGTYLLETKSQCISPIAYKTNESLVFYGRVSNSIQNISLFPLKSLNHTTNNYLIRGYSQ